MSLGITDFSTQGTFNSEIPGQLVPDLGTPVRACFNACTNISCPKLGTHKGYQGYTIDGITTYELEKYLVDCHNNVAETLRQIQGMINVMHIFAKQIEPWGADFRISGTPVYREYTFDVTSVGGSSITCAYNSSNNPLDAIGSDGGHVTLKDMGQCVIGNSKLGSHHGGFIIYAVNVTAPDGNGNGTITFLTANETPSRLMNKINGANPVTCTARFYSGPGKEIWTDIKDIYPMWCVKESQVIPIGNLTAGVNTIFSNQRIAPRDRKCEKQISGVWSDWGGYLQNRVIGGVPSVTLDLTGVDLTGIQNVRLTYWKETTTFAPDPQTIVWQSPVDPDTTPPAAQNNTVANSLRWDGGDVTYECAVWDSGEVWVTWDGAPAIQNIYNGTWYDVQWDLSGVPVDGVSGQMLYYPPTDPDNPKTIDGVRVTFNAVAKAAFAVHNICGNSCGWNVCDYSQSVGLADTNSKRYCWYWGSLTADEKSKYSVHCMNEQCQYFAMDDNSRNTWSAIGGIITSYPFSYKYIYPQTPGSLFREGAPSLFTLVGTSLDATGTRYDKIEHGYGTGGFCKEFMDTVYYDWSEPDPLGGPDIEHHDPYNYVSSIGSIENFQPKNPITNGLYAKHRYQGDQNGTVGETIVFRNATLLFPLIANTTDLQTFADGELQLGFWKADLTKQNAEDGNTVYRAMIQLRNGIKPLKDPNVKRDLATVITCQFAANVASGSIPLRHRTTRVGKPAGTGDPDVETAVKTGGTNVLLPINADANYSRPTNWACPEAYAAYGAGDSYIIPATPFPPYSLCVPADDAIPEQFHGRLIKITGAIPCNGAAMNDPDWANQLSILENVPGMPLTTVLSHCDTITVSDPDGVLAALQGYTDLRNLLFTVVKGWWANSGTWFTSSPADADAQINDGLYFPLSGRFYFRTTQVGKCFVGNVELACFSSYPSVSGDLQPIITTLGNMWSY